ncbi:NUDIX domain-containing protein [Paenibacillus chartarius]|uniref:NUDIX domain-containing protein n=1 Tax=Paenibacillus chartarius TaxID=747481 RepID=A0ABV6DKG6_9BACL
MIQLTFDKNAFTRPDAVLLFPFYQGQLLFARHKQRGWELPGGKIEENEWPIHAAIRELYEETGAETESIVPIAQYHIIEQERRSTKQIYVARAARIHSRPAGFETEGYRLFQVPPAYDEILNDARFSDHMKDQVYPIALEYILQDKHLYG